MRININAFCITRKLFQFQLLVLSIVFIILLITNRNDKGFQLNSEEIETDGNEFDYLKADIREENVTLESKVDCHTKFKLLKLQHFNDTYDDVIIRRHPNLPKFLTESGEISSSLPDISRIRWTGTVYQESWKYSPKFLLYSAHLETRINSSLFVQILACYDGEKISDINFKKYFCKIWFSSKDSPVVVPVYNSLRISYLSYSKSRLNPYALSCHVPNSEKEENRYPIAVSLVSHQCQKPESILEISASPVKKKIVNNNVTVGICGKALFYYNTDFSLRLIEWIEILKVLGVSKIFLYKSKVHKNLQKVLNFYENEGILKVITFHYPPPIVQDGTFIRVWSIYQKIEFWSVQNLYINDCLLRNKDNFDYLGVMDSDEIPIMKTHQSLPDLLTFLRQNNNKPESYFFKWKTFFRDVKSENPPLNESDRSYCFNHNIRTKLTSGKVKVFETNGKTFHDTNQIVWAFPHRNLRLKSSLAPKIKLKTLSRNVAYIGHFTDHICVRKEHCYPENIEEETALLPFREKVVQKMNKVLDILKI